jgi:hypothetical protein
MRPVSAAIGDRGGRREEDLIASVALRPVQQIVGPPRERIRVRVGSTLRDTETRRDPIALVERT